MIDALLNIEQDIEGNWYAAREWLQDQPGVVKAEYYNTSSSAGDWDGWFVVKMSGMYYLVGFNQENNWPGIGFTLYTGGILASCSEMFDTEDIWEIYQQNI